jgi:hypothetical protein
VNSGPAAITFTVCPSSKNREARATNDARSAPQTAYGRRKHSSRGEIAATPVIGPLCGVSSSLQLRGHLAHRLPQREQARCTGDLRARRPRTRTRRASCAGSSSGRSHSPISGPQRSPSNPPIPSHAARSAGPSDHAAEGRPQSDRDSVALSEPSCFVEVTSTAN